MSYTDLIALFIDKIKSYCMRAINAIEGVTKSCIAQCIVLQTAG